MAMTLTSEDAKDWNYKGEGGANLVLGYCGSSPSLVGKVLRVHKVLRNETHSLIECKRILSKHEQLVWGDIPQLVESTSKEIAEQVFAIQVMGPLLDLKHIDGGISQPSEYDPLDLFSGSREQINQAITALFTTPYNNFRIFLNGTLIFGDMEGADGSQKTVYSANQSGEMGAGIEDQIKVLIQGESGLISASFIELVSEAIFKSGVLDRLLAVQKLDVFDIEGAIHVYYNIISEPCMVCKNLGDSESLEKYSWLHTLSLEKSLKIVRDFLLAATAKDCSLMISFRPQQKSDSSCNFICLETSKQTFDYKVYFIDLDIKPLDKMVHYYELDHKIVSFYTECGMQVNNDT